MKTWRAKYYQLQISHTRKLVITVRRFRTVKARRSQTFKQFVTPCHLGRVKEIAIKLQTRKPIRHQVSTFSFRRVQASASMILILLGLGGMSFFGRQIITSGKLEPPKTFSSAVSVSVKKQTAQPIKPLPASEPTHITIPAVNIDAAVMSVGQDAAGSIAMPPLFEWTTGWYKYSPTPGQLGPSIIVGHVDTYKGISVFWRLRYVQPGDLINITRADGKTVVFKVQELKQFDQSNFPTQQVYGNLNYPGLRLITCGGTFNHATASYSQNTVVYASMIV